MRRAAQLPTLSWHGRSSAVGLPPCSLPPQDLGRVLDGGPIRHGVDSQQLVVPGSPPTACTGIQQGCQLVCPAAGTFWWCWLSPFVLHPAPPMSPHDLLLLKRLRIIPQNSTNCSYLTSYCTPGVVAASSQCFQQWRFSLGSRQQRTPGIKFLRPTSPAGVATDKSLALHSVECPQSSSNDSQPGSLVSAPAPTRHR